MKLKGRSSTLLLLATDLGLSGHLMVLNAYNSILLSSYIDVKFSINDSFILHLKQISYYSV
jgi:hypothetical protein